MRCRYRKHEARQGGGAHDERADDGEGLPPSFGWQGETSQAVSRVIARDRRRDREQESNGAADERRWDKGEDHLADSEREHAGQKTGEDGADRPGARMQGRHAHRDPRKERQGQDGEVEQQPSKGANARDTGDDSDDDHDGGSVVKRNGRASTSHHGAVVSIVATADGREHGFALLRPAPPA